MLSSQPLTLVVYSTVPWEQALAVLRYREPARMLGWNIISGKENANDVYPERVDQADAIIIQRDFARFYDQYKEIVKRAKSLDKPIVYEVDDLLFNMPSDHPNLKDYSNVMGGLLLSIFDADYILVSSIELKKIIKSITPRPVELWPNYLPDRIWPKATKPSLVTSDKIVIGYMGSSTHEIDVESLDWVFEKLLATFSKKIEIRFFGCNPPKKLEDHPNVKHYPFNYLDYAQFAAAFLAQNADIWLAPLVDNQFNRCKSLIKYWEYAAVGGASIFQAIPPYTELVTSGMNGLLANSPNDWVEAITHLINHPDLRLQMKISAQDQLRKQGYLSGHLDEWLSIWKKVLARQFEVPQVSDIRNLSSAFRHIQAQSIEYQQESVNLHIEIDARNRENNLKIQELQTHIQELQTHIQKLQTRSNQLDDILQSRSWKLLQRINNIRSIGKAND